MRFYTHALSCSLAFAVAIQAQAESGRRLDLEPRAYPSPNGGGVTRAFSYAGFEVSEGYALGSCSVNNGWRSFGANNPTPPGPRAPTGVTALQGNPGQSLLLDQNTNFPNNTQIGCFSPSFMNPADPVLNVDVFVDDNGGDNYYINPQAPSQALTTSRVIFGYGGEILVLDDLDGPGAGGLSFESTGVAWSIASWTTLQFEMDVANNRIGIWYGPNKDELVNIYNAYMFGGSLIEEVVLFSTNFQNTGAGSFTGGPAGTYFDNIQLKPEPAALGVLAIGSVLLLRRRRNGQRSGPSLFKS